ncbi:MAG: alpha/beta hydrolase [Clostridia bacterium]|nr:alpha/beta hydrolase [Clostridia bacterium]
MDVRLHYVERGCGDTLILLHGNGESGEYFKQQLEYFSRRFRTIALDTRGHGASARGNAPFTLEQFADDLYCFMNNLSIDRAHILGFSDGGNIALYFALKYPDKVSSLILNGANLNPHGVKRRVQLPIIFGYHIARFFARTNLRARQKAEMLALMVNEPDILPQSLRAVKIKTLVIAGTKDMIREKHTRLIFEALPNASLKFIEGGHFIAAKNPAEFNRAVEAFLDGPMP